MRMHFGFSFRPKDIIKWVGLIAAAIGGFMAIGGIQSARAYVKVDSTGNEVNITTSSPYVFYDTPTTNRDMGYYTKTQTIGTDWFLSPSLYFAAGSLKGEYFSVNADYYVIFGTDSGTLNLNWIDGSRNTIKPTNLRCAPNDLYKNGYSTTNGSPQVSNFIVEYRWLCRSSGVCDYAMHIRFNYSQHIPAFNDDNTNISCWFVTNPSDGLFAQSLPTGSSQSMRFGYKMNTLEYALGEDPLTSQLNDINTNISNTNILLTNVVTNLTSGFDSLDDTIQDPSIDLNSSQSFFNDFSDDNHGLSGVLTAPLTVIRNLNDGSTCDPLTFTVFNTSVSMPSGCILWDQVPSGVENVYYIFIGGFLAYILVTRLWHDINDLKDPNKSEVDTLDL